MEGYKAGELFLDLQGVTTGSNDLFLFNNAKYRELDGRTQALELNFSQ